jgi:methyl-accepting chemotaxis protein
MIRSIRGRLIASVVIMAALLGALIYLSSARLNSLSSTLDSMNSLQDFKSHVLIPQKDMNAFIGATDNANLQFDLGRPEGAQAAYDSTVDAEQDISGEFATLEKTGAGDLLKQSQQAHRDWEVATEFLKIRSEKVATEHGFTLVRTATDPTKTVDAHTTDAIAQAKKDYGTLTVAQLDAVAEDMSVSPVEKSDVAIDGLAEATDKVLAAEVTAGDKSLASASQTILFGSIGVLVAILGLGLAVATSVSRPLLLLKNGSEQVAGGNLDYTFENVPDDEVGAVIHSVQKMSGSLRDRIRTLEEVAGVIMLTGDDIQTAARAIEPKGPEVATILEKSEILKDLVGQSIKSTKS